MMDESRTGASTPHPPADEGAAVGSAVAPPAISFARQDEAGSAIGPGAGGSVGFAGAANPGGRGGGIGGSSRNRTRRGGA